VFYGYESTCTTSIYITTFPRFSSDNLVTAQFADKPTLGQSSHGLVNSPKCLI